MQLEIPNPGDVLREVNARVDVALEGGDGIGAGMTALRAFRLQATTSSRCSDRSVSRPLPKMRLTHAVRDDTNAPLHKLNGETA